MIGTDAPTAILIHRLAGALRLQRQADAECQAVDDLAADLGLTGQILRRALAVVESDPRSWESDERLVGNVLTAIGAPVVLDHVEQFERITDESPKDHIVRLRREGWFAAVIGQPDDVGGHPNGSEDAKAWKAGYRSFRRALEAAKARAKAGRRRGEVRP